MEVSLFVSLQGENIMAKYRPIPKKLIASAALVALLGTAAPMVLDDVARHEGYVPEAYKDPIGIWTKCFGDTYDVTPGETYTFEQCLESLNTQVYRHAAPVLKCVPGLADQHDKVKTAMISMAYNIGTGGFCKSSVARKANSGDWEGACKRMAEIYRTAGGVPLRGLEIRREAESKLCLEGVKEGYDVRVSR